MVLHDLGFNKISLATAVKIHVKEEGASRPVRVMAVLLIRDDMEVVKWGHVSSRYKG